MIHGCDFEPVSEVDHPGLQCLGMDFYVCLERPGFSVARRRAQKNKVGVQHKVTKDDAIKWWVQPCRSCLLAV